MARLILILCSSFLLAAQESRPPSLLESLEDLQNDFSGAMARAGASYTDRLKALSVVSELGRLIGEKREKQSLDDRAVKNVLEEIRRLEKGNVFTRSDCGRLDADAENVTYRLGHEFDVFRGYKGLSHP